MSLDPDVIDRCRRGEPAAWDALFNEHYSATARFIFQLSADVSREDAEEICQEVFLSVIQNISGFQRASQFRTWLFRIAANKTRDHIERQHAAKRGGGRVPLPLHVETDGNQTIDPPDSLPAPDAALLTNEQMLLLRESLDRLGGPCREIIELRYFADLSYEEIGNAMNMNPKTVSSRLSKCLLHLEKIARQTFNRVKSTTFPV
ncbi:MAG TPA: sigma-70 family RNA polymerase sigma factor [Chthoniobacteraceae bacterium]|nr:sigma-70 family RNA polymerase sigma factor [Chthoniobacteraceae bacterium]